jgi:hypothetical protein
MMTPAWPPQAHPLAAVEFLRSESPWECHLFTKLDFVFQNASTEAKLTLEDEGSRPK